MLKKKACNPYTYTDMYFAPQKGGREPAGRNYIATAVPRFGFGFGTIEYGDGSSEPGDGSPSFPDHSFGLNGTGLTDGLGSKPLLRQDFQKMMVPKE